MTRIASDNSSARIALNSLIVCLLFNSFILPTLACIDPVWREEDGTVVIEPESGDLGGDPKWSLSKVDRETYIGYDVTNTSRKTYAPGETWPLCFPVTFLTSGFWKFEMRTLVVPNGNRNAINNYNDVWFKVKSRGLFLARSNEDVTKRNERVRYGKGWLMTFQNKKTSEWSWNTYGGYDDIDEFDSNPREIYTKIGSTPLETEVCIAPRSNRIQIGKLIFYNTKKSTRKIARTHAETVICGGIVDCDLPDSALYKCKGRIAMSFDGNHRDTQDWGAGPMTLALIDKLGLHAKVVHVDWNNRLGVSMNNYPLHMNYSMWGSASEFGFDRKRFYDDETMLRASIKNLRNEMDASTADDPLYVLAGGPMELIYRALEETKPSCRSNVIIISHSTFNYRYTDGGSMTHDARDIKALGAVFHSIREQNDDLDRGLTYGDFLYLYYSTKEKHNFLFERISKSEVWSVADAGMAYWLLTGDDRANASTIREFLTYNDEYASLPSPEWQLHWHEEFTVEGKPDPKVWNFEIGYVRNNEKQNYTDENAICQDGKLVIESRRKYLSDGSTYYSSSSINTKKKFYFLYGRVEIRAKVATKMGIWPAAWFMGKEGKWPHRGECDLLESFKGMLKANVVWGADELGKQLFDRSSKWIGLTDPYWNEQFHVWRMDWDRDWIKLYVNDELLNEVKVTTAKNLDTTWGPLYPFRQPQWILVNQAIGGSAGGDPTHTPFPQRYEVDYIRIYQLKK
eukprot:CAMPEP_0184500638 /NCGR_PEP_ID=MMETSP0113_2-20130426/45384_1 /TAXON_ID=91329 /ORGANISM="Norrisiella sphaerica, Strain BC52" /LENGTH=738 /DNA_ID=CAMNT_0026889089 /DNA_START=116 /DNA_END=2332 /DNA_ORIENTATION=-